MKECIFSVAVVLLTIALILNHSSWLKDDRSTNENNVFSDWDLSLSQGLSLYGGSTIITPAPIIENLIEYQTFDDTALIDKSGNQNHASGGDKRGPGYLISQGNSLLINTGNNISIKQSDTLNNAFSNEFSVSFWIYISSFGSLSTEQWDIVAKGDSSSSSFKFTVDVATHSFMFASDTAESGLITLTSNSKLLLQKWTHITILRSSTLMMFYVNGNLDSVKETKQGKQSSNKDIYIGRMPWQDTIGGGCSIDFLFDEFKIWNKVIEDGYIMADAGFSLGSGDDPNSIELGCLSCDIKTAETSCTSEYHLCTTVELYSYGFSAAKSMGLLETGSKVWSDKSSEDNWTETGLAIWWRNYY